MLAFILLSILVLVPLFSLITYSSVSLLLFLSFAALFIFVHSVTLRSTHGRFLRDPRVREEESLSNNTFDSTRDRFKDRSSGLWVSYYLRFETPSRGFDFLRLEWIGIMATVNQTLGSMTSPSNRSTFFTSYTALHVIKAIACLKLPHATFLYVGKNSRNNCSLIFYN